MEKSRSFAPEPPLELRPSPTESLKAAPSVLDSPTPWVKKKKTLDLGRVTAKLYCTILIEL
jgi:hypothetical protein